MRLATATIGLACFAANAMAHPVTLNMAFISEADDGLTRQNVDALAHPDTSHELPPPSDAAVEETSPSSDTHRVAVRHHRHHHRRSSKTPAAVASTPNPTPHHRPWVMVKLIAFTHWWNGWSERNFHTSALDVHLDRPAHPDRKTA